MKNNDKSIVAPSILCGNLANLEAEVRAFAECHSLWWHLDIMDGHFVPNLTFGPPVVEQIAALAQHPLDAHLMVANPRFHIQALAGMGVHNVTFHYEACAGENEALELLTYAKQHFPSVGVSVRPKTPLSLLSAELLSAVDLLLIMSVEPGFGGQAFIENTWDKLAEADSLRREHNWHWPIQVDGGVSADNARRLRERGAANLVAGSYIFQAPCEQYGERVEALR